jgi:hypothetical protein
MGGEEKSSNSLFLLVPEAEIEPASAQGPGDFESS